MLGTVFSIAAGGALGALTRYGVNLGAVALLGAGFPYGTMIANIFGSFCMGVVIAAFAHLWQPDELLKVFIVTGFLGAFTTFSTFSLDFVTLMERSDYLAAGIYLAGSVVLSIAALFGGMAFIRSLAV